MGKSTDPIGWVTRSERVEGKTTIITLKIHLDDSVHLDDRAAISEAAKQQLTELIRWYGIA